MKRSILVLIAFFFFTSFLFSQTIQWEQLNGPFGGTALSFTSNSLGYLFAGADENQGGIFRSTDVGITWQRMNSGLLNYRAYNWFVVDDSSYIITGSHNEAKVYKSKDNGESWIQVSVLGGTSVAVNDSGHIYVGNTAYAQYSVSKDAGYTWTHYSHPSPFINSITINDSGHIFIGGNYTGYRSKDNGANWTTLSLPDGINSIAVAPNGNLFAGCSREYAANSGVYRSTDNGDSWAVVKDGFRVYAAHNIVINNSGDIIVGTWGWGIWKSTDDGDTWTQHNSGLGHLYIKSMHISNDGNVYAGASGGGIYRSDDGGDSWQQVGITAAGVKGIAISPLNGFIFTSTVGMSRSTDSGVTWEIINNGIAARDVESSEIKNIAIKPDGTIFIGFTTNWPTTFVYRSTDNGDSWVRVDNFPTGININGLAVGPNGEIIATASGYHNLCQKSTDDGLTWQDIKYGQEIGVGKVAFNSAGDLFLAGNGIWKLPAGDSIWVNLRGGGIWSMLIGSNDYIYIDSWRSTDNGITWEQIPTPGPFPCYAENSVGHIFMGTRSFGTGIWRSTDFGESWESINNSLPTLEIWSLAIDSEDYLYAGTDGYSMCKTTTPTVIHFEDPSLIAHYTFEENANDLSGYDNHGNVIGAVLTTDRFGEENSAYEFDGSSSYISISNSFSLQSPTSELTQLAWVNIYSWTGQGYWVPVLMKSNSGDNAFQYRLSIGSNGVNTSINYWENAVTTPDTINFNQWYMITSVLKNDTVKHYVNEKFVGSGTLTGPIMLDTKPLEIGRDTPGGVEYYHGKIDDIRIYNRALTATEIDSIYDGVVSVPAEDKSNIPMTFNLNQNHPNPFNPGTKISWQSPVSSHQTLKVFDILGNEIVTLVDEYKPAGMYNVQFTMNNLASGVYFYQLKVVDPEINSGQSFIQTKKMMFLK